MTRILKQMCCLVVLFSVTAAASVPKPFTAQYDISYSGLGGEIISTLSINDTGNYVFENRTRARGLARLIRSRDAVERTEFRDHDGVLLPVAFDSEDGTRRNKRGNDISFDWEHGVASSVYKDETKVLEVTTGVMDRQLMQLAMMADLANGVTETSYRVVDGHDIKDYEMVVIGPETISVPAGDFKTLKIERKRPGSSRTIIMWCAENLNYLPVRMEQLKDGKVIAELTMTEIQSAPVPINNP